MAQAGRNTEEKLARVAQRDERALGELYDEFAPSLLGMLMKILADRRAAEEVLQEVFLRLWHDAWRGDVGSVSLPVWLIIVARRAAVDRLRALRKLPSLGPAIARPFGKSVTWLPSPEEIARVDQRRELLEKVMNQLPKSQREALDLAVFGGYTENEIAKLLGRPMAKARTELRAAMTFFRHRMRALSGTWAASI